jgi:hypothetical protein
MTKKIVFMVSGVRGAIFGENSAGLEQNQAGGCVSNIGMFWRYYSNP